METNVKEGQSNQQKCQRIKSYVHLITFKFHSTTTQIVLFHKTTNICFLKIEAKLS